MNAPKPIAPAAARPPPTMPIVPQSVSPSSSFGGWAVDLGLPSFCLLALVFAGSFLESVEEEPMGPLIVFPVQSLYAFLKASSELKI
ncbi:MAG TPA: hypothetical protein DEP43_01870 [Ruminococcaceae bacterium]|nr:hypothetical protein [Oscillospiraceae bacterium]